MKQHRPRVSEENYNKVMANWAGRFGENETFDSALWLLIAEYERLEKSRKINNSTIRLLTKELSNATDLFVAENKRASKASWLAFVLGITAAFSLIYIGICL